MAVLHLPAVRRCCPERRHAKEIRNERARQRAAPGARPEPGRNGAARARRLRGRAPLHRGQENREEERSRPGSLHHPGPHRLRLHAASVHRLADSDVRPSATTCGTWAACSSWAWASCCRSSSPPCSWPRRLSPGTRIRIGSLSIDQFASVVASFTLAFFFLAVAGAFVPSMLIALLGALGLFAATVLAPLDPVLRRRLPGPRGNACPRRGA